MYYAVIDEASIVIGAEKKVLTLLELTHVDYHEIIY